jgi:hypothetical protein
MNRQRTAILFQTIAGCCLATLLFPVIDVSAEEYLNGITWEAPAVVTPGKTNDLPPSDATVLFDGSDTSAWELLQNGKKKPKKQPKMWSIQDGCLVVGTGKIQTKEAFGDCQLHIEWSAPEKIEKSGQGRGNSGIFFVGLYEIQILDSYENETYHDGQAGAIYKQTPPAVNAMRKPGEWNTYDIFWTAPRFNDDGSLESPAFITAVHNGVLILNHFQLKGDSPYTRPPEYNAHAPAGPIVLQDHGNPVRFRNIWVRPFKPAQGQQTRKPFIRDGKKETPIED